MMPARVIFRQLMRIAVLIAIVEPSRGDRLFLDFNNSIEEVEAARLEAERNGEKLWVIPPLREEGMRQSIRKTQAAYVAADKTRHDACSDGTNSAACREATLKFKAIVDERKQEDEKFRKIDSEYLGEYMKFFNRKGIKITSMVLSGHHTGKEFFGRLGSMTRMDIARVLKNHAPVCNNVRTFYSWGCYTENKINCVAETGNVFRGVCPNIAYTIGFKGSAPASANPASARLLTSLMSKEQELLEAGDREAFQSILGTIDELASTTSRICVQRPKNEDRCWIVGPRSSSTCSEEEERCLSLESSPEAQKHLRTFSCYWNAEEGCERVPDDTKKGELRKVYDFAQETYHCTAFLAKNNGLMRKLNPEAVRRLLFDKNIKMNLERYARKELDWLNQQLDELGFPDGARFRGLRGMSRYDYLKAWGEIESEMQTRAGERIDEKGRPSDRKLGAIHDFLKQLNRLEVNSCVPGSWLELDTLPDSSDDQCGLRANMRKAIERAMRP